MRALWLAAPLALTRYAAVLVAVVLAAALAAGAAASSPFVRAGVKSSSLRGEIRSMSRYAAGLSIVSTGGGPGSDTARRAAAVRFGHTAGVTGQPIITSRIDAQVDTAEGDTLSVVVMARTDATAHVVPLAGSGKGAWLSVVAAKGAHLHAGGTLKLTEFSEAVTPVKLHVSHVYQALDTNLLDPYWANLAGEIRIATPDGETPPTFVFVSERTLISVARKLGALVENQFEYPVDTTQLSYVGATRLEKHYDALRNQVSRVGGDTKLGCGRTLYDNKPSCTTSSSLDSALLIASNDVAALSATIWLLSACAIGIALIVSAAAGVFLVRRREDESRLLFARGEPAALFTLRTALEALLPTATGVVAGFAIAVLALRAFTPAGTLDRSTEWTGARAAALAGLAALVLLALAAGASFPRRADVGHPLLRRVSRLPWELPVLGGAVAVLVVLLAGGGLAKTPAGDAHPRLAVFLLPVLAAAGVAGLAARLVRRGVRGRGASWPAALFFSVRRLAAARGLLIAVVVAMSTSFGVFAYAATLSSSVSRAIDEKAYVANGSDVQGIVDPTERIYNHFPFPAVIVEIDTSDAFISSGHPVDVVAGDPAALARTIQWGPWGSDPRRVIARLRDPRVARGVLAAIASPDMHAESIVDQGAVIPLEVVARTAFPGMSGGRPAVLVSRAALRVVAKAHHIFDPGFGAGGVIWAKGNPSVVEPALRASNIHPTFMTTLAHIRGDPSVRASRRSYGYLRAIGFGAVVLALLGLVLYLQARRRGHEIASALIRRMGATARLDVTAVATEAAALVLLAFVVGLAVALAAARLVARHVDPLPLYAPGTALVVPWSELALVGVAVAAVAAVLAAGAVVIASRADASEALRVA